MENCKQQDRFDNTWECFLCGFSPSRFSNINDYSNLNDSLLRAKRQFQSETPIHFIPIYIENENSFVIFVEIKAHFLILAIAFWNKVFQNYINI